jgi:hypothetical protein
VTDPEYANVLLAHRRDCKIQAKAFEIWLEPLTFVRWCTIALTVVGPAFAGFSLLGKLAPSWQTFSAWLTFSASTAATLHAAFRCDAHQTGCKKLGPMYSALALEFETAEGLEGAALRQKGADLIKRLADLKRSTTETPIPWAVRRAEAHIDGVQAVVVPAGATTASP